MWGKIFTCCLFSILGFTTFKMAHNPLVPFVKVCKLLWDFLNKCRLSIKNSLDSLLCVNVACLLKSLHHPFSPVLLTNSFERRALKKLWIYWSRKIFSNHRLSIILVIFLKMAHNPFIPLAEISKLLRNFNLLKVMSTTIKSMCWEILICCLLSILSLSTFEVANNPFIPLSQICKLLRDFAFL